MAITKRAIIKQAILPGFWPRLCKLAGSGFMHISYLMAIIFNGARLLPHDHPYLLPQNFGKYSIRNVMAEAANNLVFSRKNIDQIIIFFLMLSGLMLLMLQFIILIITLTTQPAIAQLYANFLSNPSPAGYTLGPEQDIAFILLDRVFGLGTMFGSCISNLNVACVDRFNNPVQTPTIFPFASHLALHQLLSFYSIGILMIGSVLILYLTTTIIGETAVSGTPFGKRYNKAWVPIRIIVFFAMIIPLNFANAPGLNGAQMVTLWTAKLGSNLASNGWGYFNQVLTGSYLIDANNMIAQTNIPELGGLNQFFFLAKACEIAEERAHDIDINPYIVRPNRLSGTNTQNYLDFMSTSYVNQAGTGALNFSEGGTIIIRFGHLDPGIANGNPVPSDYKQEYGNVFPYCGEIQLEPNSLYEAGAIAAQEQYFELLKTLWTDLDHEAYASCFMHQHLPVNPDRTCTEILDVDYANRTDQRATALVRFLVSRALEEQTTAAGQNAVPPELLQKGWAGAAIWYNSIAEMNGAVTSAILNIPRPSKYPYVMEEAARQHRIEDVNTSGAELYSPVLANKQLVDLDRLHDIDILTALYGGYKFWDNVGEGSQLALTGNIFIDTLHLLFGTRGMIDLKNNPSTHPLAQLSALGRGMIEASVRNALIASAGVVGSKLGDLFKGTLGQTFTTAAGFAGSIIQITLVLGIMLYYVLPFLPFIYFMFAVSGWVKSIFEAMVAMPLWALAHIHIDGDGLPGTYASNGYFLILEIFLRPLLIIFGLLASVSIFGALVVVLNQIFDLVVANVGGFNFECKETGACTQPTAGTDFLSIDFYRSPIDQFFMTAMYTMVVYILGLSSFKLIDQIPNNLMRWLGVSVKSFQEQAGDPASQISGSVYKGSRLSTSQLTGGLSGGQVAAL